MLQLMRASCFAVLLVVTSWAMAQTEFSADVVNHEHGDKATRVYFGKDKVRFDSKDNSDPRGGGAVILNLTDESWVVIMDKQHMYMEMPAKMMESRGVFHFFKSADVDNACSDWLKLKDNKGGTCHKVGSETVNGRSTIKYEGTNAEGEAGAMWLDSKLRFPVKWESKNGGGELQNIKEGPQPASLFEIPAGYNKFDMGNMMQQHQ